MKEDNGVFSCVAKRGIFDSTIKDGLNYICTQDYPPPPPPPPFNNNDDANPPSNNNNDGGGGESVAVKEVPSALGKCMGEVAGLTNKEHGKLLTYADKAFNAYWSTHRTEVSPPTIVET